MTGVMLAWLIPAVAFAQDGPGLRPGHFTFGAGVQQAGGYDIGDATAQLRGNGPGTLPTPFTLFQATSRFTAATAPMMHVGIALSRTLAFETAASYGRPRLAVSIAGDPEAPAQELPGETVEQYLFEAGLTWQLPVRTGRRVAPFVAAGAGYLRQLHEDRTLNTSCRHRHFGQDFKRSIAQIRRNQWRYRADARAIFIALLSITLVAKSSWLII